MAVDPPGVPSDTVQFGMAFRHQVRFYLRTMRFLALLVIVLVATVGFVAATIYYHVGGVDAGGYLGGFLGLFTIFGLIIGAFLGGDAIAMDFGSPTGYYTLVLPVRRGTLLLGRYAAAFAASFVLILVYFVVAVSGAVYFHGVLGTPWVEVGESLGLASLYALGVLSVAFLFSSFFRSPATSMISTVLVLFFGLDIATGIAAFAGVDPWFSILWAGDAISEVFPSRVRIAGTGAVPTVPEGIAIMLVYAVLFLVVSAFLYQYKESKG